MHKNSSNEQKHSSNEQKYSLNEQKNSSYEPKHCSNKPKNSPIISLYTIFGPPTLINFVHGSHMYHVDIIGHVAAAPVSLACPSRSAWPP